MPLMSRDDTREGGKLCDDVITTILGKFCYAYILKCEFAIIIVNCQLIFRELGIAFLIQCIQLC
jgi:hypothetical protein